MNNKKFSSQKDFNQFYILDHQNTTNRILHFIGTALAVLCLVTAILFHDLRFILLIPIAVYLFAWIGHVFFEKNPRATFKNPLNSLVADFLLFGDIMIGKQSFRSKSL
jgi:hypothetical protein